MEKQNISSDKITDQAFSRLMITSFLAMFVCICMLCGATYAWFTAGTSSKSNTLTTGKFALDINVTDGDSNVLSANENNEYHLNANGSYTVTLKVSNFTTVTRGYCIVTIEGDAYTTQAVYKANSEVPFTFTVNTADSNVNVTFEAVWGIPSDIDVDVTNNVINLQ